jgi:uncharacterized protein with FMN-binding domain
MKYFFIIISGGLILLILLFIFFYILFSRVGLEAKSMTGNFRPDMTRLADGQYHGHFSSMGGRISSEVSFEMRNGRLWLINFDQLYGTPAFGAPQKVIDRIDSLKSLDFDVVTGATVTSNLAKAAIKDAIDKGPHALH